MELVTQSNCKCFHCSLQQQTLPKMQNDGGDLTTSLFFIILIFSVFVFFVVVVGVAGPTSAEVLTSLRRSHEPQPNLFNSFSSLPLVSVSQKLLIFCSSCTCSGTSSWSFLLFFFLSSGKSSSQSFGVVSAKLKQCWSDGLVGNHHYYHDYWLLNAFVRCRGSRSMHVNVVSL